MVLDKSKIEIPLILILDLQRTLRMKSYFQKIFLVATMMSFYSGIAQEEEEAVHYVNEGVQIGRLEITADSFYNSGIFTIPEEFGQTNQAGNVIGFNLITPPYGPLMTTHFTNDFSGSMIGDFRFETKTETDSQPAEHFVNRGSIISERHLLISADLIENSGVLNGGSSGRVVLRSEKTDLSFGKLNAADLPTTIYGGSVDNDNRIYALPRGITENFWALGTNHTMTRQQTAFDQVASFSDPLNFASPPFQFFGVGDFTLFNSTNFPLVLPQGQIQDFLGNPNYDVSAFTNTINDTNKIIQLAFFRTNFFFFGGDTNTTVTGEMRWLPSQVSDLRSPYVHYEHKAINNFLDGFETNHLYVRDDFGILAPTNRIFYTNRFDTTLSLPNNYEVIRGDDFGVFAFAEEANTEFDPLLVADPALANTVVSNSLYAGFGFHVASPPPFNFIIQDGNIFPDPTVAENPHPTNMTGRILIDSDELDLSFARIRAENYLSIKTDNYVGAPPASVDALRYDLQLHSTTPELHVTNVVKSSVSRFTGDFSMYSSLWTNQYAVLTTNVDDAGTETITTNFQDAIYQIFLVEPEFDVQESTEVLNLDLKNPNKIRVSDNVLLSDSVVIDSPDVTIDGIMTISSTNTVNFVDALFPTLEKMTVGGGINTFGTITIGSLNDLESFAIGNGGSISSADVNVIADTINVSGGATITTSSGSIIMNGPDSISLTGGSTLAPTGRSIFTSDQINIGGLTLDTFTQINPDDFDTTDADYPDVTSPIVFNVGRFIHDDGIGATIDATGGVVINGSGLEGDLSFSSIFSRIPKWFPTDHVWPAEDRGSGDDAFINNLALGTLTFQGDGFPSQIRVRGTTDGFHALYVNTLQLNGAAESNFAEIFNIADNFKIYFRNLNTENAMLLAQDVDGAYGGKFVHVPSVAGPQEAGPASVALSQSAGGVLNISVDGDASVPYVIEKTSDLSSGIWIQVGTISGSGSSLQVNPDQDQAFFRIRKQ